MTKDRQPDDQPPVASLETLRLRAALLMAVRSFFDGRGYLEVDTPLLSRDVCVDAHLEPFVTEFTPEGNSSDRASTFYLQTSPEFHMKRLLAAGAEAIYQITRAFRNGESGRLHNPEFTIVEWYRTGDTHHDQMGEVEALVREVVQAPGVSRELALSEKPFPRTTYRDAFARCVQTDPLVAPVSQLAGAAAAAGIAPPPALREDDRDGWLNLLLATLVEPTLGAGSPEFLYDYPASQASLARVREEEPPVAERFELYIRGIEVCNGYHELLDAEELRRRKREQNVKRVMDGRRALPEESRLLAAMESGLPPCSGVALGFDRLVMLAAGKSSLAEVMPFPLDRA